MTMISVSDHAVIRWLERAKGMDIAAVRREIAKVCEKGVQMGAEGVKVNGVHFRLAGNVVCTVVRSATQTHKPIKEPKRSRAADKRQWQRDAR